jgi:hypothetical protein
MEFNTVESTAGHVFKGILAEMHKDYMAANDNDPVYYDFDRYLWENLATLGEAAYNFIGDYFGDADQAAADLGLE